MDHEATTKKMLLMRRITRVGCGGRRGTLLSRSEVSPGQYHFSPHTNSAAGYYTTRFGSVPYFSLNVFAKASGEKYDQTPWHPCCQASCQVI
ncbi:hypothetical protein GN956_G799 [Arapaima gigas]